MGNRGMFISRITAVMAAVSLSAGLFPLRAKAETFLFDVNGDGTVDMADASCILQQYAISASVGETSALYDINGDGAVDITDASLVLSAYAANAAGLPEGSVEIISPEDFESGKEIVTKVVYDNFLFAGDSRTVGMSWATGADVIAKESIGYGWAKNQLPQIKNCDNTNIVFWFGVNDLYNISKYITMYNDLYESMKDKNVNIYVMAVTPCCYSYSRLNSNIENFNAKMQAGLNENIEFIDTYSFLSQNGFGSSDGLHYSNTTYKAIYDFVLSEIRN